MIFYPKISLSLMPITKDTVKKISRLARISTNSKFEEEMIKDLNSIIKFVDQLNELNIDNIEPLSSVVNEDVTLRDDKTQKINFKDDILKNSPENNENYYVVPKVIE